MNLETKKRIIEDEVEKTIGILDKTEKIKGNPFLFTRIMANLNSLNKFSRFRSTSISTSLRIVFIVALLLLNLASTILFLSKNNTVVSNDESFISSLTDEYYLSVEDDILNKLEEKE